MLWNLFVFSIYSCIEDHYRTSSWEVSVRTFEKQELEDIKERIFNLCKPQKQLYLFKQFYTA